MVFIPCSVEYIYELGICFWSEINGISNGRVQIIFQRHSKLKYIHSGFSDIDTIEILSPSIINPICFENIGIRTNDIQLYSIHSFNLCNIKFKGCKTYNNYISLFNKGSFFYAFVIFSNKNLK